MSHEPTEMEAKCARAAQRHIDAELHRAGLTGMPDDPQEVGRLIGDPMLIAVRAVARALRNPNPEMVQAMYAAFGARGHGAAFGPEEAVVVWRAGLDAASPPDVT